MKKVTIYLLAALTLTTVSLYANPGPPPQSAPDGGSAALLLGVAVTGLASVRRFVRR
jgi:hypothetical protein